MKYAAKVCAVIAVAALNLWPGQVSVAQGPADRIVSPKVHADRTVTFRLFAPSAKQVQVGGEFTASPLAMEKDEKGIWSLTTKPLEPNIYGYNFIMDGLAMPDPSNTFIKAGVIWFGSQVEVPGDSPAFYAARNVPHGALHEHWYYSKALGSVRRIFVYTPPGYSDSSEKQYPTLYLLHGMGDDEGAWTQVGRANFIMDNLLAEGKAKPALIVMPFGHASKDVTWPPRAGANERRGGAAFGVEMLEKDLLENVIPLVQREYHAGKDGNQRAIAGLSMGGYQALSIGLNNPQVFAYVGAFSSAVLNQNLENDFKSLLTDPDKANKDFKLIWIGCGSDDGLLPGDRKFEELLTAKGIKHQWIITPGYGHAWTLWRVYLRDLLPKLFDGN